MKNNLQANPMIIRIMVLITCCMLVMLYNKSKAAVPPICTFKKVAVLFKQDVAKNELKVTVTSGADSYIQLYFYSTNKKLVRQIEVDSRKGTVIKDMKKGMYIYQFLSSNLTVKSGMIELQ
jgi:hypothetical protein